ncbi:hypothetical protein ABZP36_010856 [Zizania latifolia]
MAPQLPSLPRRTRTQTDPSIVGRRNRRTQDDPPPRPRPAPLKRQIRQAAAPPLRRGDASTAETAEAIASERATGPYRSPSSRLLPRLRHRFFSILLLLIHPYCPSSSSDSAFVFLLSREWRDHG